MRTARALRRRWELLALVLPCAVYACADDPTPASQAGSPAASAPEEVLHALLAERPADFPSDHVRATLAWVDGRPLDGPETTSPDDLRELRFQLSSDVPVDVRFPLHVHVPIDALEPMHYQWLAFLGVPDAVQELGIVRDDHNVNSMPQAELVLYFDQNHNQRLDLLEPGQAGPAPDRVLAVASGRDAQGVARRAVVVNKLAPFEPPLELFVPNWGDLEDEDGLSIVHISVPADQPLAQEALLSTHGITMSSTFDKFWARNMAQLNFEYTVEALDGAEPIDLYSVGDERNSWLARGCAPYPVGRLGYAQPPPDGAAIYCGADRLVYASNPEDYCGQSDTLTRLDWQGDPDLSWWPCDERGLVAESPYAAASQPLGTSVLSIHNSQAYTGIPFHEPPTDFRCRPDIIYDFDDDPKTHLPALPPPPGSQVRCYGHDALSFIPDAPDCRRKFTYDLSSADIPGYAASDERMQWDLRSSPPPWWPCDADGNLDTASPYEAPAPDTAEQACPEAPASAAPGGNHPPAPHSKIRCTSPSSLIAVPLWADHCDGRTETALTGEAQKTPERRAGWEQPAPSGWPCDDEGKFVPAPGYEPL